MSCSPSDEAGSERCDDIQQEQKASHEGATGASSSEDTLLSGRGTSAGSSHLLTQIEKLRAEQHALRNVKKELAKNMKNAMRQKKRLQTRAMNLTDGDLVEVLRMRKAKKTAEGQSVFTAQDCLI